MASTPYPLFDFNTAGNAPPSPNVQFQNPVSKIELKVSCRLANIFQIVLRAQFFDSLFIRPY